MNKDERIITDVAVLSFNEVSDTLERITALAEGDPVEALMLLYKLLRTVRVVRRAINEKPLRQYETQMTALAELEDDLWFSAAALNDVVYRSAN